MLNISIIIPIFNGLSYTKKCLQSFFGTYNDIERKPVNYSVVIVDDGSTDGSTEWITVNFPQVMVLKGDGNLWWSGGINRGIKYALKELKADYVLWWNNDIIANKEYFTALSEILNTNDINTIIGSKIYLAQDQNTVWSVGGIFNPVNGFKDMIGRGKVDTKEFSEIKECDWLPGMGTLVSKHIYEEIGYLDDVNFPQYHGDSDFTYRAKKNGFRIQAYPNLKIYNNTENSGLKHNKSFRLLWKSLFSLKSNFNIKKDFLFYRKHADSILAYKVLFSKYFKYIGGFVKWEFLEFVGVKRNK